MSLFTSDNNYKSLILKKSVNFFLTVLCVRVVTGPQISAMRGELESRTGARMRTGACVGAGLSVGGVWVTEA